MKNANNWKNDQYGGRKGSSTDHVLIGIWDKILTELDNNSKAVVISAIDFSKSFSRCSFQEILQSYQKLGISNWGLQMHAAFLTNRRMRVKVGNVLSNEHEVTGGAVQGSIIGVMDHNAVLEDINDDIEDQDLFKYIDDLTMNEDIEKEIPILTDGNTHYFRHPIMQRSFDKLGEKCEEKGLKINERKTQLLTISTARNKNQAWLKLKDGTTLNSSEDLKLLGFMFGEEPTVNKQIEYLVNKAASRSFVIRYLSSVQINKTRLTNVYCSIIRSILEYSSVTFGPRLPAYLSNMLENVQKKCLRSIFGQKLSYTELLSESGLDTLEKRRNTALTKFAQKASNNPQFLHWFPKTSNRSSQRVGKPFHESFARTDRLLQPSLHNEAETKRLPRRTQTGLG